MLRSFYVSRCAKSDDEASVVTRFEPPGYLKKTSIHITRCDFLQRHGQVAGDGGDSQ